MNSSFMTFKSSIEKNKDFDEWIVQIKKVPNLTGKPEYVLTLAKSSGTHYEMTSQTPSNTAWSELKRDCKRYIPWWQQMYMQPQIYYESSMLMSCFRITIPIGLTCVIET